jgi:hypothetical protein
MPHKIFAYNPKKYNFISEIASDETEMFNSGKVECVFSLGQTEYLTLKMPEKLKI